MRLLADLDPPSHGLVKLRARMARRRKRRALWAGAILGPAAATAALIAVLVQTQGETPALRFDHPALVHMDGVEVVVDGGARVAALHLADGVWLVP